VTIEVADSGEGMPPEVAARVFEPYFTTKERGKGTGLGLATVHGIVRHAGGQIDVSSMPGHGATFRIAIPSTDREPVDAGQPGDAHLAAPARILLVDDDPAVLRVTERALRHAGYEVTTADSGSAARLALRERSSFELLLTDVVMPGMSGRELAREIDASATQVLFMSGYHPSVPIASPHFLAKPFDRRQLLDKVHGALAAHRAGTPPSHHVIEPEGAGRASGGGAP
jgi:CheY-like chemotaxis protein